MKLWVRPWKVRPPANQRVMVKDHGSYFDAAYSPLWDRWTWLIPGGREEHLAGPPEFFWCDGEWASANRIENPVEPVKFEKPAPIRRRRKKDQQVTLSL